MFGHFTSGTVAALSMVWSALGGVVGLALLPVTEGWVSPAAGAGIGLYVALCVAYHNRNKQCDTLRQELADFREASPRLVFVRAAHASVRPLQHPEQFCAWQLWFRNQPHRRGPNSIANNLMAQLDFCDADWQVTIGELSGQWARTRMPEHVGWVALSEVVDSPPGLSWLKLLVIAEPAADGAHGASPRFALVGENLHESRTAEHFGYLLPAETCRLRVLLDAQNMEPQEFRFRFDIDDHGALVGLTLL